MEALAQRLGVSGRSGAIAMPLVALLYLVAVAGLLTGYAVEALLAALVIPLVISILVRPQRAVLLLVLLTPFEGLLYLPGIPDWVRAWKEIVVVFALAATFVCPTPARANRNTRRLPGWVPALVGLVLIGIASAGWHHDLESLTGLKIDFFYLLIPIIVWRCPLTFRDRDRLVTILMATGFVCAVIGIGQQFVGAARLHSLGYEYDQTIRFTGSFLRSFSTFIQPFPFALFEVVVVLVGISVALSDTRRLRNRCFLFSLPVFGVAILATFVRSALLAAAAGLLYLALRRYRVLLLWFPLAMLAALFLGVSGDNAASTLSSQNSANIRVAGWEENLAQIARHPLGAGIGVTGSAALKAADLSGRGGSAYYPDNYYFKTLYELGVLGAWMFVLLLLAAFRTTHRASDIVDRRDRPFVEGVAAQIIGAAVAAFTLSYFEIFPVDLLFWTLLGIVAALGADERAATKVLGATSRSAESAHMLAAPAS